MYRGTRRRKGADSWVENGVAFFFAVCQRLTHGKEALPSTRGKPHGKDSSEGIFTVLDLPSAIRGEAFAECFSLFALYFQYTANMLFRA
jgi:hypothetical protein